MNTKLTLSLKRDIIKEAKYYAKYNEISLSKLIENYLIILTKSSSKNAKISPLIKSLTGIIPDNNIDERKEYRNYLFEKYS